VNAQLQQRYRLIGQMAKIMVVKFVDAAGGQSGDRILGVRKPAGDLDGFA
jgi:hypothetical protein